MTCDDRRNLMPLYVADALDAAERDEMRRHLASGCAACAGWLAEAEATFAAVGLSLDPVVPSPDLLRRVMVGVKRHDESNLLGGSEDPSPVSSARSWWRGAAAAMVAAAAAAAVTLAVTAHRRTDDVARITRAADDRSALLRSAVDQRDQTVADLRRKLAGQQELVAALQKPTTAVVTLAGVTQKSAAARLVWDGAGGRSILLAAGLSALPAGRTYELWYIPTGQSPRRAATFAVDADGLATVTAAIPAGMPPLAQAAVSDEPAGGTESPTGQIQLAGQVSAR